MGDYEIYNLKQDEIQNYVRNHTKIDVAKMNPNNLKSIINTAVTLGDCELFISCVEYGVEYDEKQVYSNAAYNGWYDIVKFLLERGVDPLCDNGIGFITTKSRCHYKTHKLINTFLRKKKLNNIINNIKTNKNEE